MIGTPVASAPLDDAARLRANSAASWGAIFAGAVVAISVSLLIVTLGTGLGFAAISPWSGHGLNAESFTVASTIWLILTQWIAAAAGGYVAGRLRHRWLATHAHEIFFRDTAHGLVTWGVATLFVAAVLGSSMTSLLGGGARAASGLATGAGQGVAAMAHSAASPSGQDSADPSAVYNVDKLFRSANPGAAPDSNAQGGRAADSHGEVLHIAANAATSGTVSDEDRTYLTALVAGKSGVPTEEAQKRVDAFVQSLKEASEKAKAAADKARKAAAQAALYTALALLIGAFIASVSAAIGGRLRDEHL